MEFWGLGAIFPQAFNLMEYRPFGSLKKSILSAYKIANFVRLFLNSFKVIAFVIRTSLARDVVGWTVHQKCLCIVGKSSR